MSLRMLIVWGVSTLMALNTAAVGRSVVLGQRLFRVTPGLCAGKR